MSKESASILSNALDAIFKSPLDQKIYQNGAFIYKEGERAKGVYRVIKGRVKIWKHGPTYKRDLLYYLMSPSDIFGVVDLFSIGRICRFSATALDDETVVQFVSFGRFEMHLLKDHNLQVVVINTLIDINLVNEEKYFEAQAFNMVERVFRIIKRLATKKGFQTEKGMCLKAVTHKELSDYIGVCRQNISSALIRLKREGRIEYGRKMITILK